MLHLNKHRGEKPLQKQVDEYAFVTTDKLGEGAFGQVYKGWHVKTHQKVAIKMMPKNNPNVQADLIQKEVENMQALKSPHIVQIMKFVQTVNNMYIVVELCEDGDLEGLLKKQKNGQLDEKQCIEIIRQLVSGFKDMHQQGFVHRDIKPANILVHKGVFKIADLGLSKHVEGNKMMQSICGTPLYMSPQILFNQKYSNKADIWSLGLMFYEMLFGKYPWTIRDLRAMKRAIQNEPLRFPFEKPIAKTTKDFITKCLQVEESSRFSWEQIFSHPLINNQTLQRMHSKDEEYETYKVDKKLREIIQKLQDIVSKKEDPEEFISKVFHNFDKDKCGNLNKQEFFTFLKVIDGSISREDTDNIFIMIDIDSDLSINFQEFKVMFNEYDFSDLNDKSGQILKDIRVIVEVHGMDLMQLFKQYDRNGTGCLNKAEFEAIISIVAEGLKKDDIDRLYARFDHDGDGEITFKEFYDTLKNNKEATPSRRNTQELSRQHTKERKNSNCFEHNVNIPEAQQYISPYSDQHNSEEQKSYECTPQQRNAYGHDGQFPKMSQGGDMEKINNAVIEENQELKKQLNNAELKIKMYLVQIRQLKEYNEDLQKALNLQQK